MRVPESDDMRSSPHNSQHPQLHKNGDSPQPQAPIRIELRLSVHSTHRFRRAIAHEPSALRAYQEISSAVRLPIRAFCQLFVSSPAFVENSFERIHKLPGT